MAGVDVVIFHQASHADDPPLVRLLAQARDQLVRHQIELFRRAGARRVEVLPGREAATAVPGAGSFGERLARLVEEASIEHLIVMGSGAVPRLTLGDARRLVEGAGAGGARRALTNNRYSSDVCAVSHAGQLRRLPPLPTDNALPRWLEECAGFTVAELAGRDRLALDLDTPLDLALLALAPRAPRVLVQLARERRMEVPRVSALRSLAADPRRELLVFGRSGSRTLAWLERNVRCRVRFLAEERGLRASSPLAMRSSSTPCATGGLPARRPRATLGRLLDDRGPAALRDVVGELADGAIIDTRVLMADRWGADEDAWPSPDDRFASDLLRPSDVSDPWLRDLTRSAAEADIPILLGAHTLVGPGVPILLGGAPGR